MLMDAEPRAGGRGQSGTGRVRQFLLSLLSTAGNRLGSLGYEGGLVNTGRKCLLIAPKSYLQARF
jgi:hypothetical protein